MTYTLVPVHDYKGDQLKIADIWLSSFEIDNIRSRRGMSFHMPPKISLADFKPEELVNPVPARAIQLATLWSERSGLSQLCAIGEPEDVREWLQYRHDLYWDWFWRGKL